MRRNQSMGMRKWSDHWQIRVAWVLALVLLISTSWSLYFSIRHLKTPRSPHYKTDNCFTCHEANRSKMTAKDCFKCHDPLTRGLLPNALADREELSHNKPCFHPIKSFDGRVRTVTELCLSCHKTAAASVAFMNFSKKSYIEIDMGITHPIGQMPTETVYPKTLPLSKITEAIDCGTCHDPHGLDRRFHLLRYYYPGNGRPADFRPLCNDCHHEDGWLPLKLGYETVIQNGKGH